MFTGIDSAWYIVQISLVYLNFFWVCPFHVTASMHKNELAVPSYLQDRNRNIWVVVHMLYDSGATMKTKLALLCEWCIYQSGMLLNYMYLNHSVTYLKYTRNIN